MTTQASYLLVEATFAFGAVLGTHAFRRQTSLVFCYAVLAFMVLAGWAIPHSPVVPIGPFVFSIESSVFFSAALVAVFLLYVADGPVAGRMGIAVVLGTGLLYLVFAQLLHAQFGTDPGLSSMAFPVPPARAAAASLLAVLLDLVLMAVTWEALQRSTLRVPLFVRVLCTLLLVLATDALLYVTLGWSGEADFGAIIGGAFLSRLALSAALSPVITAYLHREMVRYGVKLAPRPVFSIITREDLERELLSARHNLRIGAEALWASDERYRRMVEDIPTMVFRFAADGRVTYANQALASYYDRSAEDIVGTPVLAPIDKHERDDLWKRVLALTPDKPTVDITAHAYPRPHERRLQRWRLRGIFGPGDQGLAFQAVGEDITREAMLEAQVQQAHKMEAVGLLAGGIAHDFNNLLMVIWSCAEIACRALSHREHEASGRIMEALRDIRLSADSAAIMTRQLMAISRHEQIDPRPVHLASVVSGAVPLLKRLVPGGIRLEVVAREDLPPVLADATELERVLVNLVANARDAVPVDGGLIDVSTDLVRADEDRQASDGADQVVLVVRDNGPGMDAETRKRVFEPFFTTKGSGGNGFGLTTVYAIVQRAGGNIEVDSEPGGGTTFTIRLPAYHGPDMQGEQRTSRETAAGEMIWYCEGDERVRRDVLTTLEDAGYQVQTAPDAEAMLALAATSTAAPSLVVTDSIAPGMPGTELVATIRERFPGVPTVIFSGRPPGETGTSDGPGHAWFVHKPYRRQELLARVAEALGLEPEQDERVSQAR